MGQHNCRIGKTYFKYPGYVCHVGRQVDKLTSREIIIHEEFIKHLLKTGKMDKSL